MNPSPSLPRCLSLIALLVVSLAPAGAAEPTAYQREVRITPLFKTQTDYAGRKLVYPTAGDAEVTAVLVEIPPGRQTGWHKHPVPCFAYLLEGELELELETGVKKVFRAGDALPEVVDLLHNGVNAGPASAKLVMFALGTVGQPYAVRSAPSTR